MARRRRCLAILTNHESCPRTALSGSYIYHGDSEIYDYSSDKIRLSWVRVPLCAWHLEALIHGRSDKYAETFETSLRKLRAERKLRREKGEPWVSDKLEEPEEVLFGAQGRRMDRQLRRLQ